MARDILEVPAYGTSEAAHYLQLPRRTLEYWVSGSRSVPPIVVPASSSPARLSFMNLLECHMLSAMRTQSLRLPRVRRALTTLQRLAPCRHPLVEQIFETDGLDLFIRRLPDELINLSRGGQLGFRAVLDMHLRRIERDQEGVFSRFFPFVIHKAPDEPRIIEISPTVAFGRPVIAGTGICTAVICSRFNARESVSDLAAEYGRAHGEIEEAIRWEARAVAA